MDQLTVYPKANIVLLMLFILKLLPVIVCAVPVLFLWNGQNMFLLLLCSSLFALFEDLPKFSTKALQLDREGVTAQRYLLKDIRLPYSRLSHVWLHRFYFEGYDLDTNVYDNQREIIDAFNVYRTQGLITAPERKPNRQEILAQIPLLLFLALCIGAYTISFIYYGVLQSDSAMATPYAIGITLAMVLAFLTNALVRYRIRTRKSRVA